MKEGIIFVTGGSRSILVIEDDQVVTIRVIMEKSNEDSETIYEYHCDTKKMNC